MIGTGAFLLQSSSGEPGLGQIALLLFWTIALPALGFGIVKKGFSNWQRYRLMMDTPTEKAQSMAAGRTELNGVVRRADQTLDAACTDADCVYVRWEVEVWNADQDTAQESFSDRYSRLSQEAQRAENRNDTVRSVADGPVDTDYGPNDDGLLDTVATGERMVPFELEDETGCALVRPDTAAGRQWKSFGPIRYQSSTQETSPFEVFDDDHRFSATFAWGQTPSPEVLNRFDERIPGDSDAYSRGKYQRFTEHVIPVGSDAYVLGGAELTDEQGDYLEIRRDDSSGEFVIADIDEAAIYRHYQLDAAKWLVVGTLCTALSGAFLVPFFL